MVLVELRRLRSSQPALAGQIELLERYLNDFDRLAAVQRIVQVEKEKVVEKLMSKPVLVPTQDSESLRSELALALLVEKLIAEIKRIKKDNPNVNFKLDNEVGLIFFPEVFNRSEVTTGDSDFDARLKDYTR